MKHTFYLPLTAAPFSQTPRHREVLPKSPVLSKYIRCFWGSEAPFLKEERDTAESLVIPDICADILYQVDHTSHTVTGGFCGINDAGFFTRDHRRSGHLISTFAIRFYAWTAYGFSGDSLKGTLNGWDSVQSRFRQLDEALRPRLLDTPTLEERSALAEDFLFRQLDRLRQHDIVDHAVKQILLRNGVWNAADLAKECFISSRQLERLFHEYIGITPKKLCNLVRYQCLWNDILRVPDFSVLDAVHKYGYTDQSHLMKEFKRYHTMDIRSAKKFADPNVENIQYIQGR